MAERRPADSRGGSLLLVLSLLGGASGSLAGAAALLCRCLSGTEAVFLIVGATLVWWAGAPAVSPSLRRLHLAVPLLLPLAGPVLVAAGTLVFRIFRKKDYLSGDPTLHLIFNPPRISPPRKVLSLEELLEQDRKIVPAGDILRWGEIPLKQALIDRLAGGEITPRVIRILRGARNDPDEEVRLFATTILTRLEKTFQERIRSLLAAPDPQNPDGAPGRSYVEYAESGLVGDRLSRALLRSGLEHYHRALVAGEELAPGEILHVGGLAAVLGKGETLSRARKRLEDRGARRELEELARIMLYEEGRWEELREEIAGYAADEGVGPLPEHLSIWAEGERTGGRP